MASDSPSGTVPPRQRPAPTIDLKATEVTAEPVKDAEPAKPAESARPSAAPAASAKPAQPAETSADLPKDLPPAQAAGGAAPPPRTDSAGSARTTAGPNQPAAASSLNSGALIGASAGVVVTLLLFLVLWAIGLFGPHGDPNAALTARIATLETQLRDVANRPPPPGVDQRVFADLAARVGAAEQTVARLAAVEAGLSRLETTVATQKPAAADPALASRIAALESAPRALADLAKRVDAVEATQKSATPARIIDPAELAALAQRLAALEQAEKALEQRVARPASAGPDQAGRVAFVATALRSAVERGDPFAAELAAAKALAPDAASLAPLDGFAAGGLPRPPALARELAQLAPAILAAAGSPRESGLLDRLQQNAERLVRVRPVNGAPGDDVPAIVARAEAKAREGDLAGAIAELTRLPDAARAPAQAWIARAQTQVAALAAARTFADTAVAALAKASP